MMESETMMEYDGDERNLRLFGDIATAKKKAESIIDDPRRINIGSYRGYNPSEDESLEWVEGNQHYQIFEVNWKDLGVDPEKSPKVLNPEDDTFSLQNPSTTTNGGENEMSTEDGLAEMPELWNDLYETAQDVGATLDVDISIDYDGSEDPEQYVDQVEDLLRSVEEAYKRRDELDRQMADELGNRLEDVADDAVSVVRQASLGSRAADDLREVYENLDDVGLTDRTRELFDINDEIYEVGQEHGVFEGE